MTNLAQAVSSRPHLPPGLGLTKGPPPARSTPAMEKVQVVEASGLAPVAEVTNAELLKAIQDLGQKLHTLSRNQQALETRLISLQKKSDAIEWDVIAGAVWLSRWNYCILMNLPPAEFPFWPDGMATPHWK